MNLSIEHAVGQKMMLSFAGLEIPEAFRETLQHKHVGGVTLFRSLNVAGPAQVRALSAALQEAARAAGQPPLLIAADQEGGQLMALAGTTPFPGNMALGAISSPELAYQVGLALGRELLAMGVNVNYAPSCDVNVNPRNPVVGVRSFGEDSDCVAKLCAAMIRGMQHAGVAATAKHFPGHGDTDSDTHHGIAVVPHDRDRLDAVEIPPFRAAIDAGVQLVMSAHIALPALDDSTLPATLSPNILRGLLREELGFCGIVISDAMEMAAITQGAGLIVDTLAANAAGIDLFLLNSDVDMQRNLYGSILQATQRKLLSSTEVLASAERVLALKRWLADFEQPSLDVINSAEHTALARDVAERSVTLVRNDAGVLPLKLAPDARIAVVVPQSADLTPADTSSYERCELARAVRAYHADVAEYSVSACPTDAEIAAICERAADYDFLVVGTINAFAQTGQATLVNALLETGVPTIAVALRMPYDLAVYPRVQTYACTYSILPPSMEALAAALWGDIPFRGCLPVSIPDMYPLGHGLR